MTFNRLKQQLDFLHEIDKLKTIFRQSLLLSDHDRRENSAEHSWHLAMYVLILSEYANERVEILKVIKMVLLHDLVEIYAGDTYAYDTTRQADAHEREVAAANKLFAMLPADQHEELISLWHEFEAGVSAEAKFAASIDRLQPLLHNYLTDGKSWRHHKVARSQVVKRMQPVKRGSVVLNELVEFILEDSVKKEYLVSD